MSKGDIQVHLKLSPGGSTIICPQITTWWWVVKGLILLIHWKRDYRGTVEEHAHPTHT